MTSRRDFIKNTGLQAAGLTLFPWLSASGEIQIPEEYYSIDENGEDYWARIQEAYSVSRSMINLNNGGVSPQPTFVQDAFKKYTDMSNEAPSVYMWRRLEPTRKNIRTDLAQLLGCEREEIVINRNTTEALDTIIFGLDLKKGDEVVLSKYDYPNMKNAWEQRKKRDGIVLKYVNVILPDHSDEEIVQAYSDQITSKTKLVHITHMVNYNGQVLPAKEICQVAKKSGAMVMLDGAHTFAHIDFNLNDLEVDFFATSLHKWLCSPFGTGLLYIRKELISKVWPFYPTNAKEDDDIHKFEAQGTRNVPGEIAVGQAIVFHRNIGIERKTERLRSLSEYWVENFQGEERFIRYTPEDKEKYAALFTFGVEGMSGREISNALWNEYRIVTSPINIEQIDGCRISPHVYTTHAELDKLVEGIKKMMKA